MTIRTAKNGLVAVWFIGILPFFGIVALRTLSGFYENEADAVWLWVVKFVLPNLTLIGGSSMLTGSPEDIKPLTSYIAFYLAVGFSLLYIGTIYYALGTHVYISIRSDQSSLFLGSIQSIVIGFVGRFFTVAK